MMKKIFILFSVLFFVSCKNTSKESTLIANNDNNIKVEFKFKTFVEVQKKSNDYLVFQPCDGATKKLKWNKNNLLEITEKNEDGIKEILKGEYSDNGFRIYITELDYYDFSLYDKKKEIFEVNYIHKSNTTNYYTDIPKFVVDSLNLHNFKLFNQPCIECYTQEQCISMGEIPSKPKKAKTPEENTKVDFKRTELSINEKEINLELPVPSGYNELPRIIEVYKLKGDLGSFLFVTGERECGECPSFVSTYTTEGELLSYSYKIKKSGERHIIASRGNNSDTFKKYSITSQEINIQMNNPETPKFEIKNWK